jgi:preprotein translocase subunit SecG
MQIIINILLVFEILVALLIVLLVLMQRPKNEGLGAAFGGGMTENIFGAQTTNVLQKLTRNLGIAFFILTTVLSWLYVRATHTKSEALRQIEATAPLPPPTPAPTPAATPAAVEADKSKASPESSAVSKPVKVGDAPEASPAPKPEATPVVPDKPLQLQMATPAPTSGLGTSPEPSATLVPATPAAMPATPAPSPAATPSPEGSKPSTPQPATPKPGE